MAGFTLQGKLQIDLVEVWQWASSLGITTGGATGLSFSRADDALVVQREGVATPAEQDFIEAPDFWAWVIDQHLPDGMAHYETVFGVPAMNRVDGTLDITFASSNLSDPRTWATPPACLAEWA